MNHYFNVNVAKYLGVYESIFLNNLFFWIIKNKANHTNFKDGYFWTYNSMSAYEEIFPYLTKRQINYIINKLVDRKIIKVENYNNHKYDRTQWYTIIDETTWNYLMGDPNNSKKIIKPTENLSKASIYSTSHDYNRLVNEPVGDFDNADEDLHYYQELNAHNGNMEILNRNIKEIDAREYKKEHLEPINEDLLKKPQIIHFEPKLTEEVGFSEAKEKIEKNTAFNKIKKTEKSEENKDVTKLLHASGQNVQMEEEEIKPHVDKMGKCMLQNCNKQVTNLLHASHKIVTPIPDINTNNKTAAAAQQIKSRLTSLDPNLIFSEQFFEKASELQQLQCFDDEYYEYVYEYVKSLNPNNLPALYFKLFFEKDVLERFIQEQKNKKQKEHERKIKSLCPCCKTVLSFGSCKTCEYEQGDSLQRIAEIKNFLSLSKSDQEKYKLEKQKEIQNIFNDFKKTTKTKGAEYVR